MPLIEGAMKPREEELRPPGANGPPAAPPEGPEEAPQGPQDASAPAGEGEDGGEGGSLSPEDQQMLEQVVLGGVAMLHGIASPMNPGTATPEQRQLAEEARKGILGQLKAGADQPVKTLARITVRLIEALKQQSSGNFPAQVVPQAASELIYEVCRLAQASGAFHASPGEKRQALIVAYSQLSQMFPSGRDEVEGFMRSQDPKQLQEQMQADMQQPEKGYGKPPPARAQPEPEPEPAEEEEY